MRIASLPDRALVPALTLTAIAWIALAQIVEARALLAGVLLHLLLMLAVVAALAVMGRSRSARISEAGGVAHDLRGPLITIQTTLELLAADGFGALPDQARVAVLRAAATSARAAEVVERTLLATVTQGRSGRPPCGTSDLDVVVREAVSALDVQVRSSGATVRVDPLPCVAGDSTALFRVFVNLLQNGLKYHRPGTSPSLTVTGEVDGGWAFLAVRDHGIGIPEAERALVFEPRHRTALGAAQAAGSGLGLTTVYDLVSDMGGAVWVDRPTGSGTTIRLRLPLA